MDKGYLLYVLRLNLEYYRDSIDKMKADPGKVGPYGARTPFFQYIIGKIYPGF
jgi:hypothetical protein